MAVAEGIARNPRIEQEGRTVVLRFLLESGDEKVPCEMRGSRAQGLLQDGDEISIRVRGKALRDRNGLVRPLQVDNLTSKSSIRLVGANPVIGAFRFFGAAGFSLAIGLASSTIVAVLRDRGDSEPGIAPFGVEDGSGDSSINTLDFLLIALAVSAIVFLLTMLILPRLRRNI